MAGLFLVWEIFSGWRRGIIRAGLHFGAFVASGFLGLLAGQGTAALVGVVMPGFSLLAGFIVGVVVTLVVLGVCLFLSAIVFKRTHQQPPGLMRWFFGIGGAFFGLLTGLFLLWASQEGRQARNASSPAASHSGQEPPPARQSAIAA